MFVRPLALLISNNFTCFLLFCNVHVIASNLDQMSKSGPSEVKKLLPSAFDCTWCVQKHSRLNASLTVEPRPSQPASHAYALAGPRSPSLLACAVAVICGRTWSARLNAETSVRLNAGP
jgi:hypothetical protein